jgi:hypothetical protein
MRFKSLLLKVPVPFAFLPQVVLTVHTIDQTSLQVLPPIRKQPHHTSPN